MPIPAPTPTIVPATAEKTFAAEWVRNFAVRATSPIDGSLYLELCPFDDPSKEILHGQPREIRADLWDIVANVPEAAAAMTAVFAAIPAIDAYLATLDSNDE